MLASGDGNDHIGGQHCSIRAFDTLWHYAKDSAHRHLVIVLFAKVRNIFDLTKEKRTFIEMAMQ